MFTKNQQIKTQQEEIRYRDYYLNVYIPRWTNTEYREDIFIPRHTSILIWETKELFLSDLDTISYMSTHNCYMSKTTPVTANVKFVGDYHFAVKDTKQQMVNVTNLLSFIKYDLTGRTIPGRKYGDGMLTSQVPWMKLYEDYTYVPGLGKNIIGYLVWEMDLPDNSHGINI